MRNKNHFFHIASIILRKIIEVVFGAFALQKAAAVGRARQKK